MLSSEGIEARVRRIVAQKLGVSTRALDPGLSLRDHLAADEGLLHELVLAVEARLGVRMEERVLDEVKSYGELVRATLDAVRVRRERLADASREVAKGRARIVGTGGLVVERSGVLTPYLLEGIVEDARRAGPGARVTITTEARASDAQLASLRDRLGGLARLGVIVEVVRSAGASPLLRTSS